MAALDRLVAAEIADAAAAAGEAPGRASAELAASDRLFRSLIGHWRRLACDMIDLARPRPGP